MGQGTPGERGYRFTNYRAIVSPEDRVESDLTWLRQPCSDRTGRNLEAAAAPNEHEADGRHVARLYLQNCVKHFS